MSQINLQSPTYSSYADPKVLELDKEEAIEIIMTSYGNEIKRLVFTYLKSSTEVDDVTQEIFVTVYEKLHSFKGESTLRSWVYSIAINKSKDYLRKWKFRNLRIQDYFHFAEQNQPELEVVSEDIVIKKSEQRKLYQQVMSLPVKYREVIVLFYFEDLSTKEISDVLQIKDATVRTRLVRGRELLRNIINKNEVYVDGK